MEQKGIQISNKIILLILILSLLTMASLSGEEDFKPLELTEHFATHYTVENGLPYSFIQTIVQDKNGFLYLGTWGGGIYRYDGRNWEHITIRQGLLDNRVISMAYDGNETIYASHIYKGISSININTLTVKSFFIVDNFEVNRIAYYNGELFVTTFWKGLYILDTDTGKSRYFSGMNRRLGEMDVSWRASSTVFKDSSNRIWVGTRLGVYEFDGKEAVAYYRPEKPFNQEIRQITELPDRSILVIGERFIGRLDMEKGIIRKWDIPALNHMLDNYSTSFNNPFLITPQGQYLLATSGGIRVYNPNTGSSRLYDRNVILSYQINDMFMDREGSIWILTQEGITKLRPPQFYNIDNISGLSISTANLHMQNSPLFRSNPDGMVILYFPNDKKAIEILDKQYRFIDFPNVDPNSSTALIYTQKVASDRITDLSKLFPEEYTIEYVCPEEDGGLWISLESPSGKLFHYNNGVLTDFSQQFDMEYILIEDMKIDHKHRLLLATENNGLIIFHIDSGRIQQLGKQEGLASENITGGIAFDRMNNIYLLTATTLSIFNDFTPQAPLFTPFIYKAEDINQKSLPVYFKKDADNGPLTLPEGFRDIAFFSTTNSFLAEKSTLYRFRCKPRDKQWSSFEKTGTYRLTGLPPGQYSLQFQGKDHQDRIAEGSFDFIIPHYWYETTTFLLAAIILGIMLLIFCGWGIVVMYTKKIKEQARLLEKKVQERTVELRKAQNQLIEAANLSGKAEIAIQMLHNLGNILNSLSFTTSEISHITKNSKAQKLKNTKILWQEFKDNIEEFLRHSRGRTLLDYHYLLGSEWEKEIKQVEEQNTRIKDKIQEIQHFIIAQEKYTQEAIFLEKLSVVEFLQNAQKILGDDIFEHQIILNNLWMGQEPPHIMAHKSKVLHILLTIYQRAVEQLKNSGQQTKIITTGIEILENKVQVNIQDNAPGLSKKEIIKMFQAGYTPQYNSLASTSQLISLHTCTHFMTEMNGKLSVKTSAETLGTTFSLEWPLSNDQTT